MKQMWIIKSVQIRTNQETMLGYYLSSGSYVSVARRYKLFWTFSHVILRVLQRVSLLKNSYFLYIYINIEKTYYFSALIKHQIRSLEWFLV